MIEINAPAKLNLTLEVLGKRPDNFHEIRSVLQTISLHDTLYIESGKGFDFMGSITGWETEKSLLSRVVRLLSPDAKLEAKITLEKHIPLMAGLGGDSSDAAALLKGLNEFWGLQLSPPKLREMSIQLGSDVTFFLRGGTALAEGRGEIITPLPPLKNIWMVLVMPETPAASGKTGRMYAALKSAHYTDGSITGKLVKTLRERGEFSPALLFNTFENVAFEDDALRAYREHLIKLGAPHVHLAGAGPALFAMFQDKSEAGELYRRCRDQGMPTYLAETA